ncbi:hypothetical protein EDD11_002539 [Mortierella claussenii]|nr:hypothetical protein EDD11_002539 [Mortierella claussenii]
MALSDHHVALGPDLEQAASDSDGNRTLVSPASPSPRATSRQHDDSAGQKDVAIVQFFQNVAFYLNPFLGSTRIAELEKILYVHGGTRTQNAESGAQMSLAFRPTHIITDDLDIPDYRHAAARGIHIVKPEWVLRSARMGKQLNPQHFSADPAMIFSGVVLTATGLPQYDRDLIANAVEDYGGLFTASLTSDVTHMIAIAPAGEKYDEARRHPERDIKIVLPHWFQQCCNLKRRLPETIYEFPNPAMLDNDFTATPDTMQGYAPQLYSNTVKSVTTFLNAPSAARSQFLDGYHILFGDDLNILPERRSIMEKMILEAGGIIVKGYSSDVTDILICRFRIGATYIQASKEGKTVGSADWLLHILQKGEVTSPKAALLHYPIPPEPIPGMSSFVMTISNYTGSVREYLKRMIVAVGAIYKPTLSNQNAQEPTTHIICGNASGDKYERGQEWNVKVVNHLWLEDCFQLWALQSESKPRYTLFPSHYQLPLIFGANVLQESIDEWLGTDDEEEASAQEGSSRLAPQNIPSNLTTPDHDGATHEIAPLTEDSSNAHNVPRNGTESGPSSSTPPKATPKKSTATQRQQNSEVSTPTASAPSSPTAARSNTGIAAMKERDLSPTTSVESPALGSVRVVSRKRGAAVQASKALQKIVPDMNVFQDELRDEKKASKKKKKHLVSEEIKDDEAEDMDVDEDEALPAPKKGVSSPMKRKRASIGGVEDRSTSGGTEDEDEHDGDANTAGSKVPPKRGKKVVKAEKEEPMTDAANTSLHDQTSNATKTKRVRYISTGVKEPTAAQAKALKALGILTATTVEKCTHLVATGISRTGKFLNALLQGKIIVREDWLQACIDANAILDEDDFRIEDTKTEEKLNMSLYESLDRAREKRVFENCVFYLSPSLNKDMPGLRSVVEAGGGKASTLLHTGLGVLKDRVVKASKDAKDGNETKDNKGKTASNNKRRKSFGDEAKEDDEGGEDDEDGLREKDQVVAVVSSEKDRDMWKPIVDAGAHVYSHDLISPVHGAEQLTLKYCQAEAWATAIRAFQPAQVGESVMSSPVVNVEVLTDDQTGDRYVFLEDVQTFFLRAIYVHRYEKLKRSKVFVEDEEGTANKIFNLCYYHHRDRFNSLTFKQLRESVQWNGGMYDMQHSGKLMLILRPSKARPGAHLISMLAQI